MLLFLQYSSLLQSVVNENIGLIPRQYAGVKTKYCRGDVTELMKLILVFLLIIPKRAVLITNLISAPTGAGATRAQRTEIVLHILSINIWSWLRVRGQVVFIKLVSEISFIIHCVLLFL